MSGPPAWIGLSGTPGVGKTTVAKLLRRRGLGVWDGKKLAKEARAYVGRDRARRTKIVDVLRVARFLRQNAPSAPPVIIDSHWSHEVPGVDAVIVLRLRPRELRRRLAKRRWPLAKIAENLEAEGIGIILAEAAKRLSPTRVAELDVTGLTAREVVDRILPFIQTYDATKSGLPMGRVDWSKDFDEWARPPSKAAATVRTGP